MKVEFSDDQEGEKYRHPGNQVRIVNLAARGMLVVSVARHAGFCAIHLRNRLEGRPGDPEAIRRLILAGGEVRRFRPSVSAPGRRGHRARYRSLRFRGLTPRSVLEKFAAMQMIDVHLPTTDGRELVLTRCTEPEAELSLLLQKLKLELPTQPPPRITAAPVPPIPL